MLSSYKYFICLVLFALGTAFPANSQDIHFSQFSASPSTLNPAQTGAFNGMFRVVGNYKDQWRSIGDPYTTYSGAFDMPFLKDKITNGAAAYGLSFLSDKAGDLNFATNVFTLSLAANKSVNKQNNFSLGLQGGFGQRGVSADASKQQWGNQYIGNSGFDQNASSGETTPLESITFGDFSTGLLWRYTAKLIAFNAGAAIFHLNTPKQSFYKDSDKLFSKIAIHGGSKIDVKNKNMSFLPEVLFLKQGPQIETNAGLLIKYVLQGGSKYPGKSLKLPFISAAGIGFKMPP